MSDPEVVGGEVEPTSEMPLSPEEDEEKQERRGGSWYGLIALILLLVLLLCCATTTADVLITRGPQQASFVARNLECLQCHTEKIPDLSRTSVHSPFLQRDCTVCHTKHGAQVSSTVRQGASRQVTRYRAIVQWLPLRWWFGAVSALTGGTRVDSTTTEGGVVSKSTRNLEGQPSSLVMPPEKICYMCHGDMGILLDDTYTHVPFMQGRCTECHDPHASDYRALLTQAPNKICFTCHPIGQEINRMQAHPPAKQGWCTDCHNPHASNFKGILVSKQRDLCFSCHPSVASMSDLPTQHQPFYNDNCTGCHEPHGSDSSPLLVKPQPNLCYTCHPQVEGDFGKASHHPIGLDLTCGTCHNPHAAQYPKLLAGSGNAVCLECHGDKESQYANSAHADSACVSCHSVHGSAYDPLLVGVQPDLCLDCHPTAEGSNKHPIRPKYYDLHAKKGLTCTSSCHNPHGTEFEFMIKDYNFSQDGVCLQCHKTVGIYY
ncbi:MAG: hypothetical protein HGB10_02970 [Coriobacteriia bacterium]|nr:hypothetical protein [Coriobacteriia bacterium]